MEHEVFVPVPLTALRRALGDPTRVPDCVPGLRAEPGPEPRTAPGGEGIAVHGRLRLRAASHTITYRGALRLTVRPDDSWALHVSATEARGEGSVRARLSLTLAEAEGGTRVRYAGSGEVVGRLLDEAGPQAAESALHRLLNRFAANLGRAGEALTREDTGETGAESEGAAEAVTGAADTGSGATQEESSAVAGEDAMTDGTSGADGRPEGETAEAGERAEPSAAPEEAVTARGPGDTEETGPEPEGTAGPGDGGGGADVGGAANPADGGDVADAANPVDASDAADDTRDDGTPATEGTRDDENPATDDTLATDGTPTDGTPDADTPGYTSADDDLLGIVPDTPASVFDTDVPPSALGREDGVPGPEEAEPPAEAAHARRTMIGRSAEEVDHAPPRGRYAPEAVGGAAATAHTLRWAAPVAALVVASAVVAGRALRRRH
ncbi:membrane protein [Streptomyces sp. SPB074]|uniref:membrane protein n=1 Tax=Streptomyces sp. (strain SPB074) TaxID=465543 RepID=UPI000561B61F|nr:membrane protein [Streptomyces sp. SPB074]